MELLALAVAANVDWCALVAARGGVADEATGVWLVDGVPHPLFPDAVTLRRSVSAVAVADALADRPACSVKDSHADVELAAHGFRELFTARWIALESAPAGDAATSWWTTVRDTALLGAWCTAAGLPRTLPETLLGHPDVRVLAVQEDDRVVAGAIANRSGEAVGLSNVFHVGDGAARVWEDVGPVVAQQFPGLPVLGYESGSALDAALAAGFTDLGPVRVWLRP